MGDERRERGEKDHSRSTARSDKAHKQDGKVEPTLSASPAKQLPLAAIRAAQCKDNSSPVSPRKSSRALSSGNSPRSLHSKSSPRSAAKSSATPLSDSKEEMEFKVHKLKVCKVKTEMGDKVGKLTSCHWHDNYGVKDVPKTFLKLSVGEDEKFMGYFQFQVPPSVELHEIVELRFKFNYKQAKGWSWALKNNRTNMYATIGLTTSATSQWKMMSTSISRPDRYINKEGEIKFRLKGSRGKLRLDFVQLTIIICHPAAE